MPANHGAIVIFARMSSSRLPGKVLADIGGKPLLGHLVERMRTVGGDYPVVIATSDETGDDAIADFAAERNLKLFRGSLQNTVKRAADCTRSFGLDHFVRICGDSPFADPDTIRAVTDLFRRENADLATNVFPRSFPVGASVEVIRVETLDHLADNARAPEEREHLTRYFYEHPSEFKIVNHECPLGDLSGMRLAVDTDDDLTRARWIAEQAGDAIDAAPLETCIQLTRRYESLKTGGTAT